MSLPSYITCPGRLLPAWDCYAGPRRTTNADHDSPTGRRSSTRRLRRNSTREPTSTTTASPSYVLFPLFPPPRYTPLARHAGCWTRTELTLSPSSDRQPLRPRALRRCARLRDRLGHHLQRRSVRLLGREDGAFAVGQAHRGRGGLQGQCLVGTRQQAHDSRGTSTVLSPLLQTSCSPFAFQGRPRAASACSRGPARLRHASCWTELQTPPRAPRAFSEPGVSRHVSVTAFLPHAAR